MLRSVSRKLRPGAILDQSSRCKSIQLHLTARVCHILDKNDPSYLSSPLLLEILLVKGPTLEDARVGPSVVLVTSRRDRI